MTTPPTPEPTDDDERAEQAREAINLPAPLGGADGVLDVDALRNLAPQVRTGLIASLRHAATLARQARGTVVVPEDTYDLVRRLTDAGEVLRTWASAFTAAATEADALVAEEALACAGAESDGALMTNLYVPDGATSRIAVRADWKAGASTWDVPSLIGWLTDDTVADRQAAINGERERSGDPEVTWTATDATEVAAEVVERLLALGSYSPSASKIEALRKKLAGAGRDSDAAIIRQVRSVGAREYRGVKVTREVVEP